MIQFKLKKDWIIPINEQPFKLIDITIQNVLNYENDIKWLIECFHKRYNWDGFLKWEDIINRLQTGKNIFFLCQYNDTIIGWVWARKGEVEIDKEHIKFYCKIPDNMIYAYNNFMVSSKIINKPVNSAVLFLNLVFNKLFDLGFEEIVSDIETSNKYTYNMCNSIGMCEDNWISDLIINVKDKWGN